jgi:nitroreductase
MQPTQIVLVEDRKLKDEIAEKAMIGKGNQHRTRDCSVLAIFCSDLQPSMRIPRILELERSHTSQPRHPDYLAMMPITTSFMLGEGHVATFLKQAAMEVLSLSTNQPMPDVDFARVWSYKNTSLMVQSYVLAATSHNLHTSIMEGFDPRNMKEILHVPDERYGIPMVVATGYEYRYLNPTNVNDSAEDGDTEHSQTARLNIKEVVFKDTFGVPIEFDAEAKS